MDQTICAKILKKVYLLFFNESEIRCVVRAVAQYTANISRARIVKKTREKIRKVLEKFCMIEKNEEEKKQT